MRFIFLIQRGLTPFEQTPLNQSLSEAFLVVLMTYKNE